MSDKQVEVTCPCCTARLSVDIRTAKVMRYEQPAAEGKRDVWASAQEKVRGRTESGLEKLENALNDERGKKDRLDDLFQKAKDKLKRPADDEV